ncbi:hypothetical protein QM565_10220 [Geitlerinema splendidum]|nr:hypothetical protein [Geitlerinema splendidum]
MTPSGIVDGSDDNDPSALALTVSLEEIDDFNGEFDSAPDLDLPDAPEILDNFLDRPIPEAELELLDFAIADSEVEMLLDPEIQPELDLSTEIELPESVKETTIDSLDLERTTNENELSNADENVALETEDSNATLDPEEAIAETEPSQSEGTEGSFEVEEIAIASEEMSNDGSELATSEETEISDNVELNPSLENESDPETTAVENSEGSLPEMRLTLLMIAIQSQSIRFFPQTLSPKLNLPLTPASSPSEKAALSELTSYLTEVHTKANWVCLA